MLDALGRKVTEAIDASKFAESIAKSLQNTNDLQTVKDTHEEISNSEKLPKNIAEQIEKILGKDIDEAVQYLKDIKDHLTNKKSGSKGGERNKGAMMESIAASLDKLSENLSRANRGGFDTAIVRATALANKHLESIAESSAITAKATNYLARLFGHKGSGYVHDIHTEAILGAIHKDIRSLADGKGLSDLGQIVSDEFIKAVRGMKAPGLPGTPTTTAGGGETEETAAATSKIAEDLSEGDDSMGRLLSKTIPVADRMDKIAKKLEFARNNMGLISGDGKVIAERLHLSGKYTEEQARQLELIVSRFSHLSDLDKARVRENLRTLKVTTDIAGETQKLIKLTEELAKKQESQLLNLHNLKDDLHRDMQYLFQRGMQGTLGKFNQSLQSAAGTGVDIRNAFKGIWGEQIKNNTALHEALFVTEGWGKESDSLRKRYKDLSRDVDSVMASGQDILTYQKQFNKNLRIGIRDEKQLNRVTTTGLNLATMIGANAESTADELAQWSLHMNMSTASMSQFARHVRFASQVTGVMGDELASAVKTSKELAMNMRNSGQLTAQAAGQLVQATAAFKKAGVEDIGNSILKALSGTQEFFDSSPEIFALLGRAAPGKIPDMMSGGFLNDPKNGKLLVQGLQDLRKQFANMDQTAANMQLKALGFKGLGHLDQTIKAATEAFKTPAERMKELDEEIKAATSAEAKTALMKKKDDLELHTALGDLTNMMETGVTDQSKLASALRASTKNLGTGFDSRIQKVLTSTGKTREVELKQLVDDINKAQENAAADAKAASDPVLGAQRLTNKLQAELASKLGQLADTLTRVFGPGGLLVLNLLGILSTWATGVFSNTINGFIHNMFQKRFGVEKQNIMQATQTISKANINTGGLGAPPKGHDFVPGAHGLTTGGTATAKKAATTVTKVEKAAEKAVQAEKALAPALETTASAAMKLAPAALSAAGAGEGLASVLGGGGAAGTGLTALMGGTAASGGTLLIVIAAIMVALAEIAILIGAAVIVFKTFEEELEKMGLSFDEVWEAVSDVLGDVIDVVWDLLKEAFRPLGRLLAELAKLFVIEGIPAIKLWLASFAQFLMGMQVALLETIKSLPGGEKLIKTMGWDKVPDSLVKMASYNEAQAEKDKIRNKERIEANAKAFEQQEKLQKAADAAKDASKKAAEALVAIQKTGTQAEIEKAKATFEARVADEAAASAELNKAKETKKAEKEAKKKGFDSAAAAKAHEDALKKATEALGQNKEATDKATEEAKKAADKGAAKAPLGPAPITEERRLGGVAVTKNYKPIDPMTLSVEELQNVLNAVQARGGRSMSINVAAYRAALEKKLAGGDKPVIVDNGPGQPGGGFNLQVPNGPNDIEPGGFVGGDPAAMERALGMAADKAAAIHNNAVNVNPVAAGGVVETKPGAATTATAIGRQLAGQEAPAGVKSANAYLSDIAANTAGIRDDIKQTNQRLGTIINILGRSGGSGVTEAALAAFPLMETLPVLARTFFNSGTSKGT